MAWAARATGHPCTKTVNQCSYCPPGSVSPQSYESLLSVGVITPTAMEALAVSAAFLGAAASRCPNPRRCRSRRPSSSSAAAPVNVPYAVALIREGPWIGKGTPAMALALVDLQRRTARFWNVH
jgi:hypothetical protein